MRQYVQFRESDILAFQEVNERLKPMQFESGEVVRLKSGGPRMTVDVAITDGQSVNCSWFDTDYKLQHSSFSVGAIEKVEAHRGPLQSRYNTSR